MPYQLIYTSAAQLLDSPLSGYGVVARSEGMPAALVRALVELSEYKEPAEQGILGPQFSYRVEECNGCLYHVFTSVRAAGADYSKRSCHIAHHLVLRTEEMHTLCRGAMPPTPAGILLSLELRRYWVHRWQKEPEYIDEGAMPPLWESPAVENFPTWLIFTGKGENARALQTPPYQQGCLVLVPEKTQSRDILRLLHESSALSPTLGWGLPFCTYSVEDDALESQRRLCSVAGSALHKRAARTGYPALEIKPGLTLPPPAATPVVTASAPTTPLAAPAPAAATYAGVSTPPTGATAPAMAATAAMPKSPTISLHALGAGQEYSYTEDRSNDVFEKPWRKERRRVSGIAVGYVVALALLAAGGAAACLWQISRQGETPQSQAAPLPPQHQPAAEEAQTPHSTPEAEEPSETPEEPNESQTPEPAPQAEDDTPTQATPETETPQPETPQDETPQDETPPEPSAGEENDDPEEATDSGDTGEEVIELGAVELGEPMITLVGEVAPLELQGALPGRVGGEKLLEVGDYYLHVTAAHDTQAYKSGQGCYQLQLAPGKGRLILRRTSENDYLLSTSNATIPHVLIRINDEGRLESIMTPNGQPAALAIPVVDEKTRVRPQLLLPMLSTRLKATEKQRSLPQAKDAKAENKPEFNEKWAMLMAGKSTYDSYREESAKEAAEKKKTSWAERWNHTVELTPGTALYLPRLGMENKVKIESKGEYDCAALKERLADGGIALRLKHVCDPVREVHKRFTDYMNAPVASGKTPGTTVNTLGQAWQVVRTICKVDRTTEKQRLEYVAMYHNKPLGDKLRRICANAHALTMAPIEGKAPEKAYMRDFNVQRRRVEDLIKNKKDRKILLDDFTDYFSKILVGMLNDVRKEYEEAHQHVPQQRLELKDVRLQKVGKKWQLLWSLKLQKEP